MLKWFLLFLSLGAVTSCGLTDPQLIETPEVVVPPPGQKIPFFWDKRSIDVTHTQIKY